MAKLHFRFSTALLRRLGEELNPSLERGLIELAKNAYDADATQCVIELKKTDKKGGTVHVWDNGTGMSAGAIKDSWLVLGSSTKDRTRLTPKLRRVPAGSKGLGRLAALRMGEVARLKTRPESDDVEHALEINWTRFDRARLVEEVDLTVKTAPRPPTETSGTTVELRKLRGSVGRMEVKRIARELLLLADPFGVDPSSFKPILIAPEFEDLARLVANSYFDQADFHLNATLDRKGRARAEIRDFRGKVLFKARHADIAVTRDKKPYKGPESTFDFWTFILNKASFGTRAVSLHEVREWLSQFGGVHIFDAGLRVHPYGNPGNDWLELNLRRAQSPEERPSTNNSIGRFAIRDSKGELVQKTDRSGFIESPAFNELRAFGQDVLDWMARRRMEVALKRRARDKERRPKVVSRTKNALDQVVAKLPEGNQPAIKRALDQYIHSRDREVTELKQDVQLYRTLSTAGITAATFAHESHGSPIKVIATSIKAIERRGRRELGAKYDETLKEPVESIAAASESIAVLGSATLRLVDHEKRRQTRVNLHEVLQGVLDTFRPFLSGREIQAHVALASRNPYLRGSEAAIESIITNILNNSITAFESFTTGTREIWIRTEIAGENWILTVDDNGPGIKVKRIADIWLPGFSTRPNGTGLGLSIVRDSVADLGGTVDANAQGEHGGAEFTITLPIIGA